MLQLVLNNSLLLIMIIPKLFPEHGVSRCNSQGLSVHFWPDAADDLTYDHHRSVHDFWIALNLQLTLSGQPDNFAHHLGSRNSNMCQSHIPVILGNVSDLGPDITNLDPWHRIHLIISNPRQKSMNSLVLSIHQQPGEH